MIRRAYGVLEVVRAMFVKISLNSDGEIPVIKGIE